MRRLILKRDGSVAARVVVAPVEADTRETAARALRHVLVDAMQVSGDDRSPGRAEKRATEAQMAARRAFLVAVLEHNDEPTDDEVDAMRRSWAE